MAVRPHATACFGRSCRQLLYSHTESYFYPFPFPSAVGVGTGARVSPCVDACVLKAAPRSKKPLRAERASASALVPYCTIDVVVHVSASHVLHLAMK